MKNYQSRGVNFYFLYNFLSTSLCPIIKCCAPTVPPPRLKCLAYCLVTVRENSQLTFMVRILLICLLWHGAMVYSNQLYGWIITNGREEYASSRPILHMWALLSFRK